MQNDRPTICVALDGVLAQLDDRGVEHIGKPIPGAREFCAKLLEYGWVVIYTTRTSTFANPPPEGSDYSKPETWTDWGVSLITRVRTWLDQNGIPYSKIYVGDGKPKATAYIEAGGVPCSGKPDASEYEVMAAAAASLAIGNHDGKVRLQG